MIESNLTNVQTFEAAERAAGTVLSVTLRFARATELHVRAGNSILRRGTDYTISYTQGDNELKNGCSITLLTAQTEAIVVSRLTAMLQELSLALNGRLPGPGLEFQLDRLALALQDLSYITLTVEEAAATYLSLTGAAATYLSIETAAGEYMPISWAADFAPMSHVNWSAGHVPTTGTTGYYLRKTATGSEWADLSSVFLTIADASSTYLTIAAASSTYLTIANAINNYLMKSTASTTYVLKSTFNSHANSTAMHVPTTGTTGYYLKKTASGTEWAAGPSGGGGSSTWGSITGDLDDQTDLYAVFLTKDLAAATYVTVSSFGNHLADTSVHVPTSGTTGYYLKKTSDGCEWAAVSGGGGAENAVTYTTTALGTPESSSTTPVLYTGDTYDASSYSGTYQERGHVYIPDPARAFLSGYALLVPEDVKAPVESVELPGLSAVAQTFLVWLKAGAYLHVMDIGVGETTFRVSGPVTSSTPASSVMVEDWAPDEFFSIVTDGWYIVSFGLTDGGDMTFKLWREGTQGWEPGIAGHSPVWADVTPVPEWGRIKGDISKQHDLAMKFVPRVNEIESVPSGGVVPGHVYAKTLTANATLAFKWAGSGYAGSCHIFINPGTYTLSAGTGLTLVDALEASKVNFCEIVFTGTSARLYVLDTWSGTVPTAIDDYDYTASGFAVGDMNGNYRNREVTYNTKASYTNGKYVLWYTSDDGGRWYLSQRQGDVETDTPFVSGSTPVGSYGNEIDSGIGTVAAYA
jgi:hypothetical protein